MIDRKLQTSLEWHLSQFPVVALLGPRQVGKTTLALQVADASEDAIYLDLERPSDRAKLSDPELYLRRHSEDFIILDEIQRIPEVFTLLRSEVDARKRAGKKARQFLILGSASRDLLQQSTETLAGRIAYLELAPLSLSEVDAEEPAGLEHLWFRGGFPDSFLAASDRASCAWREHFIATYVERDIPQLTGMKLPAERVRRLWQMLAHGQGNPMNASQLAQGLGISSPTITHYIDTLADLYLVRQLPAWSGNSRKRLVKSPRVYVRDAGLVHELAGLPDLDTLLGHPLCGPSWEGFIIEQILASISSDWQASYFRSSDGWELDLVLESARETLAIEIKRTMAPKVSRGFRSAFETIGADRGYYVCPVESSFALDECIDAISVIELIHRLYLGGE